jgi:hypothetical protein
LRVKTTIVGSDLGTSPGPDVMRQDEQLLAEVFATVDLHETAAVASDSVFCEIQGVTGPTRR